MHFLSSNKKGKNPIGPRGDFSIEFFTYFDILSDNISLKIYENKINFIVFEIFYRKSNLRKQQLYN